MRKAVSAQGSHGVPTGQGSGGAKHALLAERIRMEHMQESAGVRGQCTVPRALRSGTGIEHGARVEMHCRTLLDVRLSGTAAQAIDEASFFERSH